MSTRHTITIRFRAMQLEKVADALDLLIDKDWEYFTGGERSAATSARKIVMKAQMEIADRIELNGRQPRSKRLASLQQKDE